MKKRKLIEDIGKIVEDIISNNEIGLEELNIKKTQVEIGLNYLNTKSKISADEEEGSMFKNFEGDK